MAIVRAMFTSNSAGGGAGAGAGVPPLVPHWAAQALLPLIHASNSNSNGTSAISSTSSINAMLAPVVESRVLQELRRVLRGGVPIPADSVDAVSAVSAAVCSSDDASTCAASLLLQLCKGTPPHLVTTQYSAWLATALAGLSCAEERARGACLQVLRLLVPLAAVARGRDSSSEGRSDTHAAHSSDVSGSDTSSISDSSVSMARHILARGTPPDIRTVHGDGADARRVHSLLEALEEHRQVTATTAAAAVTGSQAGRRRPRLVLRDYQWQGVSWITYVCVFGLGGVLADDMGLGKTLQALVAVALHSLELAAATPTTACMYSLVVCPSSLVPHWIAECSDYFPPRLLQVCVCVSSSRGKRARKRERETDRPAALRTRCGVNNHARPPLRWTHAVLDEAHLIKNGKSVAAAAVHSLRCIYRLALTGTPVQNRVAELWPLLHFAVPGVVGEQRLLATSLRLSTTPQHGGRRQLETDADKAAAGRAALRRLHTQVLPFLLRRTKEAG
eukprot:GSChrysophyteH2.ASY1.ANO1.1196.1 assembled CDS